MTPLASWSARAEPLAPLAAIAFDAVAARLARRLLGYDDALLARLSGSGGTRALAVTGEGEDLPWVDGIAYLGRSPLAPSLLVPTHREPRCGDALFERALLRTLARTAPPLAVSPEHRRAVSLAGARPIDRARLTTWLEQLDVESA